MGIYKISFVICGLIRLDKLRVLSFTRDNAAPTGRIFTKFDKDGFSIKKNCRYN